MNTDYPEPENSLTEFEEAVKQKASEKYVLRLFISGMTPKSVQAIDNLKKICEEELSGNYSLEIVDVSQQPQRIRKEDVIATPTLIKELPKPIRRIIGDLSDKERILVALNITSKQKK
jgi:circadian clock protein KaiB